MVLECDFLHSATSIWLTARLELLDYFSLIVELPVYISFFPLNQQSDYKVFSIG